jgi:hypothetical protein
MDDASGAGPPGMAGNISSPRRAARGAKGIDGAAIRAAVAPIENLGHRPGCSLALPIASASPGRGIGETHHPGPTAPSSRAKASLGSTPQALAQAMNSVASTRRLAVSQL